jgi:type III secretion system low calcium response chaperone LcrH/SycD
MDIKKAHPNDTEVTMEQMTKITKLFLEGGFTFRQAKGISEADMESIYSIGFNFYNNGKYKEACQLFSFLVIFDHFNKKYWLALGCARQMNKEYDLALRAFMSANMHDMSDPIPYVRMAECMMILGSPEMAERALNAAISLFGDKPKYKADKEQAIALISFLQQNDREQTTKK